jgi:hypothetical protein
MQMRELLDIIDNIDLVEALDTPLEYKQTDPNVFEFVFDTPSGEKHSGMILFHKNSSTYASLLYEINGSFDGFNTEGFARKILSTVIASALVWIKQNPKIIHIGYSADKDDGTNDRRRVYQSLTQQLSKKYGFAVAKNDPSSGEYIVQVR